MLAGTVLAMMDAAETAARGPQAGRGSECSFGGGVVINSIIASVFLMPAGVLMGIIGAIIGKRRNPD